MSQACKALNKKLRPCGNAARPGSDYCDVPSHQALASSATAIDEMALRELELNEQFAPVTTRLAAELPPSPAPAPPPPFGTMPLLSLEDIPTFEGPAAELAAGPRSAADKENPKGDNQEDELEEDDELDQVLERGGYERAAEIDDDVWRARHSHQEDELPELPDLEPIRSGRWTPEKTGKLINPALNSIFEQTGKKRQTKPEETYTAEVFAPILDDVLGRVDPNSPWGALSLWAFATLGPRYGGDLVVRGRRVVSRVFRRRAPLTSSSSRPVEEASHQEAAAADPAAAAVGWHA